MLIRVIGILLSILSGFTSNQSTGLILFFVRICPYLCSSLSRPQVEQFINIPLRWVTKWFFTFAPYLRLNVQVPPQVRRNERGAECPNSWAGLRWRASRRRRRDAWRYQLTQPPGPHLGPLPSSSTPLCVRGWGHRPQVGRRAGWRGERVWTLAGLSRPCLAGRSSCRRRRRPRPSASPERDPSGSDSPSARSGEGTGRAGQGLCGQHSSQHLWTAAWSESGRCGFVALACCSVDSSLTRLPSLPAAQRLEPGYPRSVRRPERAMTVRWLGPRMQELARWMVVRQAGDAHLLVCGKDDIYTCKLWL